MKDFIPYSEALELKQLGFDEPCFGCYEPNGALDYIENHILKDFPYLAKNSEWQDLVAAPTFSQAFRFFREKYDLQCWIHDGGYVGKCCIKITGYNHDKFYFSSSEPMEYEEAELDCLKGLIELVKQKQ
jgi:hypothetical protein